MSTKDVSTWTCDRCGVKEEVEPTKQPSGWGRVFVCQPPKSADSSKNQGDFCGSCLYDILVCAANPPPRAEPAAPHREEQ